MFVLNKKTQNVQECHNMDAIKACMKDSETYAIAEKQEDLETGGVQESGNTSKKGKTDKSAKAVKTASVTDAGDENNDEGQRISDQKKLEDETGRLDLDEEQLTEMELQDLRKKAEELGISGCGNMNKETLVAMILNH